jgi:hypothetical protein
MLFGVGLVLFDLNKDAPRFSIRVRAQRFLPDMFYANEFADRLGGVHRVDPTFPFPVRSNLGCGKSREWHLRAATLGSRIPMPPVSTQANTHRICGIDEFSPT